MDEALLRQVLGRLAAERPVFHSEADFQHALAIAIRAELPDVRIRLEIRLQAGRREALDLLVVHEGRRIGLELKYLVRRIDYEWQGERFVLRTHSAHDVRRYDVCKDIARLERFAGTGLIDRGYVVVLSNDAAFWAEGRGGTIDAAFRLHEGRLLEGKLAWSDTAGLGTIKGRADALALCDRYPVRWTEFADVPVPHGRFRSLVIPVIGAAAGLAAEASLSPKQ